MTTHEREAGQVSRLTDLLRQVEQTDEQLARDLSEEFKALSQRRAFGLNLDLTSESVRHAVHSAHDAEELYLSDVARNY